MKSSILSRMLAITILVVLIAAGPTSAAISSCNDVATRISPCINYLKGYGGGGPPAACCSGVRGLKAAATTRADRRTACNCIKGASASIKPRADLARSLPGKCGVSLSFEVSPNVDCSRIG